VNRWPLLLLVGILIATVWIRWPLLGVPLERDEGEYAVAAQRLLEGEPPYRSVYSLKFPGVYLIYAAMFVAGGESVETIHAGLLVANLLSVVLVYRVANQIVTAAGAITAAGCFAAMTVSPGVLGLAAQTEHFVVLFALVGMVATFHACKSPRWIWLLFAGLCFGAAMLVKQHAAVFLGAGWAILWFRSAEKPWLKAIWIMVGAGVPICLTAIWMWSAGVLDRFFFWTVQYSAVYAAPIAPDKAAHHLLLTLKAIWNASPLLSCVSIAGAVSVVAKVGSSREARLLCGLWALSLLAILPGLYFRRHYFVLLLPAAAISAGYAVDLLARWLDRPQAAGAIAAVVVVLSIADPAWQLIGRTPAEVSRMQYGNSPFVDAVAVGEYIRNNSAADGEVAVIGSEPEIYFYANRRSATPFVYTYEMMRTHDYASEMQRELIGDVEQNEPEYLVFVGYLSSWLMEPGADQTLLNWFAEYSRQNYEKVGVVENLSSGESSAVWGGAAANYNPTTRRHMIVYRRR